MSVSEVPQRSGSCQVAYRAFGWQEIWYLLEDKYEALSMTLLVEYRAPFLSLLMQ